MLEGKEVEGKIGEVGNYGIDVDVKGNVKVDVIAAKDLGHTKVSNVLAIETNIFAVAEEIAKKTQTTWDDSAVAGLKAILGIKE